MSIWTILLCGWAGMALKMSLLYLLGRSRKNAGIVDAGWAAGLAALAVCYALAADGYVLRRARSLRSGKVGSSRDRKARRSDSLSRVRPCAGAARPASSRPRPERRTVERAGG